MSHSGWEPDAPIEIRIHMKYIGFPLVGDYLYNPDMEYITRQALHSYRLTFLHPITGQKMDFYCSSSR